MYYDHFGLSEAPFKITPNTDFFFSGGNRGPVLDALVYAITRGEGMVKVTGEVGSGKTMLCNMLQNRLPENVESVSLATLEEIRLLSNLETRNDKLLQIVLFGQPELDENLRRPEIRQLRDRITH